VVIPGSREGVSAKGLGVRGLPRVGRPARCVGHVAWATGARAARDLGHAFMFVDRAEEMSFPFQMN
jgi:hypothetical protein